ncbi:MAG: hypothetical protein OHK93_003097 [Ramalina farinacea]|uniref:Uncharacterized protein n=1 Tax=Ramalina farinacea TaxID=258253 RepID=A0AA43QSL6_9LECA|nr:hypothetical protein [Ramalina farinacea]
MSVYSSATTSPLDLVQFFKQDLEQTSDHISLSKMYEYISELQECSLYASKLYDTANLVIIAKERQQTLDAEFKMGLAFLATAFPLMANKEPLYRAFLELCQYIQHRQNQIDSIKAFAVKMQKETIALASQDLRLWKTFQTLVDEDGDVGEEFTEAYPDSSKREYNNAGLERMCDIYDQCEDMKEAILEEVEEFIAAMAHMLVKYDETAARIAREGRGTQASLLLQNTASLLRSGLMQAGIPYELMDHPYDRHYLRAIRKFFHQWTEEEENILAHGFMQMFCFVAPWGENGSASANTRS